MACNFSHPAIHTCENTHVQQKHVQKITQAFVNVSLHNECASAHTC